MTAALKDRIKSRMQERNLSIVELERRAGLKGGVRNILSGLSKKPSAETLQAIADVLDCSVRDLLGTDSSARETPQSEFPTPRRKETPWNKKLFIEVVEWVDAEFIRNQISPTTEQAVAILRKIYNFCVEKNEGRFDPRFAEWAFEAGFLKQTY